MADKTKTIEELKALRDEIRVKIHLAEMNAREFWSELEPKLADLEDKIERGGVKATKVANIFVDEMTSAFKRLRDRLGGDGGDGAATDSEAKPAATDAETKPADEP